MTSAIAGIIVAALAGACGAIVSAMLLRRFSLGFFGNVVAGLAGGAMGGASALRLSPPLANGEIGGDTLIVCAAAGVLAGIVVQLIAGWMRWRADL